MMRGTIAVAAKEFRHLLHDRTTLAVTLLMPIVQLLFYGYILDTRVRNVPTALVNLDQHQAGRLLAQRIAQSPLFALQQNYKSEAEIKAGLRTGSLRVGIEIPADFTSKLMYGNSAAFSVWVDGADVATSNYILTALDVLGAEESRSRSSAEAINPRAIALNPNHAAPIKSLAVSAAVLSPSPVKVKANILFNPSGRAAVFLLPGIIALLIQAITTLLLVFSFTSEREQGTLEQMLISGMPRDSLIAGKCLTVASVGLAESVFLVWLMQSLFQVQVQGTFLLLAATLPLLVLAPIGFGLLIASVAHTQARALQIAPMLLFPSVMLSGFIFPREFLNFPSAWISNLLPTTFLVALSRTVMVRGASFSEAALSVTISLAFGITVIAAGWFAVRRSL